MIKNKKNLLHLKSILEIKINSIFLQLNIIKYDQNQFLNLTIDSSNSKWIAKYTISVFSRFEEYSAALSTISLLQAYRRSCFQNKLGQPNITSATLLHAQPTRPYNNMLGQTFLFDAIRYGSVQALHRILKLILIYFLFKVFYNIN